jgi:hypothetical protein
MREADIHPCFSCRLADCDDRSKGCNLRHAAATYRKALAAGTVTDTVRARYAIAHRELYCLDHNARRSEQRQAAHV